MNLFHWTRGALCAALLTAAGAGHAQSYYGLGTAPDELASYGYAYGVQILDDETAIYYLAEYDPQPTNPNPPEAAIIALHKGNDNRAFIAVEPAPATDANGAAVPGRRIAAAEVALPYSKVMELAALPTAQQLVEAVRATLEISGGKRTFSLAGAGANGGAAWPK